MGPNGEEMETCAVVTCEANKTLHPIHHRMPVVIPEEAFDLWLDCRNVDALTASALLVPAPEDLFEAWEISRDVNKVTNDYADLMRPVRRGQAMATEQVEAATPVTSEMNAPPKHARRSKKDDRQQSLF
jgi:hypothetical protein